MTSLQAMWLQDLRERPIEVDAKHKRGARVKKPSTMTITKVSAAKL